MVNVCVNALLRSGAFAVLLSCVAISGAFAQIEMQTDDAAAETTASQAPASPPREYTYSERALDKAERLFGQKAADASPEAGAAEAVVPATGNDRDRFMRQALKSTIALMVVIALILLLYAYLNRRGRKVGLVPGARLGRILGRLYLNSKSSLHFVQTGGRVLLVGVTPNGMSLIAEFDAAAFEEGEATPMRDDARTVNFAEHLRSQGAATRTPGVLGVIDDEELTSIQNELTRLRASLREDIGDSSEHGG